MDARDLFEPEEVVGKAWHRIATRLGASEDHDAAGVALGEVAGRLAVFFRGLGGAGAVEIRPVADAVSAHRLGFLRRLGTVAETLPRASFDGAVLRLLARLAVFPAREANAALYLWRAAVAAHAGEGQAGDDPLVADLVGLRAARAATLEDAPGLRALWHDLAAGYLTLRARPVLPPVEAGVEAVIRHLLADAAPLSGPAQALWAAVETGDTGELSAPRRYRPLAPVPLWPEPRPFVLGDAAPVESRETGGTPESPGEDGPARKARRHATDQADRTDSFILHKFEALLSAAHFVNLNRRVEDDDEDSAKKAADDADEFDLGQVAKAPATWLRIHIDLAPEDADLDPRAPRRRRARHRARGARVGRLARHGRKRRPRLAPEPAAQTRSRRVDPARRLALDRKCGELRARDLASGDRDRTRGAGSPCLGARCLRRQLRDPGVLVAPARPGLPA